MNLDQRKDIETLESRITELEAQLNQHRVDDERIESE